MTSEKGGIPVQQHKTVYPINFGFIFILTHNPTKPIIANANERQKRSILCGTIPLGVVVTIISSQQEPKQTNFWRLYGSRSGLGAAVESFMSDNTKNLPSDNLKVFKCGISEVGRFE